MRLKRIECDRLIRASNPGERGHGREVLALAWHLSGHGRVEDDLEIRRAVAVGIRETAVRGGVVLRRVRRLAAHEHFPRWSVGRAVGLVTARLQAPEIQARREWIRDGAFGSGRDDLLLDRLELAVLRDLDDRADRLLL